RRLQAAVVWVVREHYVGLRKRSVSGGLEVPQLRGCPSRPSPAVPSDLRLGQVEFDEQKPLVLGMLAKRVRDQVREARSLPATPLAAFAFDPKPFAGLRVDCGEFPVPAVSAPHALLP